MSRAIGVGVGILVLIGAVVFLRAATMTVHEAMPPDSELTVRAEARWRGSAQGASRLARALAVGCVAETKASADLSAFRWSPGGRFRFTVAPALDTPDRRQLRGCLSDLRMSSLLVSVRAMHRADRGPAR